MGVQQTTFPLPAEVAGACTAGPDGRVVFWAKIDDENLPIKELRLDDVEDTPPGAVFRIHRPTSATTVTLVDGRVFTWRGRWTVDLVEALF